MANESENVYESYYRRVDTQLSGENNVFLGKYDAQSRSLTNWMVIYIPRKIPRPSRRSQRTEDWMFEINCFANTGIGGESAYKLASMADTIKSAFDQVDFPLQDWVGDAGVTTLGYIQCSEVSEVQVSQLGNIIRSLPDVVQLNCAFTGFVAI